MGRKFALLVVLGCATAPTGCASARYVSRQADSGVVAIPANTDAWPFHYRREGEELIRRHVGPDFEIVDEGEVVTGAHTFSNAQSQTQLTPNKKNPNLPGEQTFASGTSTSVKTTEWQIAYRRRPGAAAAPAGGSGAPGAVQPAGGPPARP